jgi:hypothetical protein
MHTVTLRFITEIIQLLVERTHSNERMNLPTESFPALRSNDSDTVHHHKSLILLVTLTKPCNASSGGCSCVSDLFLKIEEKAPRAHLKLPVPKMTTYGDVNGPPSHLAGGELQFMKVNYKRLMIRSSRPGEECLQVALD